MAQIGFLIFPGMLQLDFTSLYGVLAAESKSKIHLLWKETNWLRVISFKRYSTELRNASLKDKKLQR